MAALSQTGHGNSMSTRYMGVLFWSHNMRLLRYDIHVAEEGEREGGREREREGGREGERERGREGKRGRGSG